MGLKKSSDHSIRKRLEKNEDSLSPFAARSQFSLGRSLEEIPSPVRTDFQRDRDRIIHCKAFRRLKDKTQVFIAPVGDHYANRLTHTLQVSQIARTIARALNVNEDLTEAISTGHDMGHTPFGHLGESELNNLRPSGFRHSQQSLRIVECIENNGLGLNLTKEVRDGILHHSKPKGDFLAGDRSGQMTIEAQIVRISDAIAYLNHDLLDAFRSGVLQEKDVPSDVLDLFGRTHSQRVNSMVSDVIDASWSNINHPLGQTIEYDKNSNKSDISMSPCARSKIVALRTFMFERVYIPQDIDEQGESAREIVRLLYSYYRARPDEMPLEYRESEFQDEDQVVDYVSGMTDRFALRVAEMIKPGISKAFEDGRVL